MRRTPHLVITGDPTVRQVVAALIQHLQRQLMAGLESDLLRDARLLAPGTVLRPLLGEIKPKVDQSMFYRRDISHINTDLAVLDFAEPTAPLSGHADGLGPL